MKNIPSFTSKDGMYLFHFAFVPHMPFQREAERLSSCLVARTYRNAFYKLSLGKERKEESIRPVSDGGSCLAGAASFTHATLMHFWASAPQAARIAKGLGFFFGVRETCLPTQVLAAGLSVSPKWPRFLGKPNQNDAVSWICIERDALLMKTQKALHSAVTFHGGAPVTRVGEKWTPHWTLAAAPYQATQETKMIVLDEKAMLPQGAKTGRLALGLSGPNGQFRCVLAYVDQFEAAETELPQMVQRLVQTASVKQLSTKTP